MLSHPIDKDAVSRDMAPMNAIFSKSLVAARDLSAGARIGAGDIAMKKPGTGIPAHRLDEYLNRRLRRDVARNCMLADNDFEPRESGGAE
jgi:N-acetylneuraminate synthase